MKTTTLFSEFRNSLKNPWAEELIDLVLYRPLAFILVKCIAPLPLTPNQVSGLAMIAGIAAGFCFAGGTPRDFVLGGVLFGLSNVLDCADGMIARLKKNGTKTGRIVDGLVDYVASGAVYIGFGIGLTKAVQAGTVHLPFGVRSAWLLVVLAVVSAILHSISSDYFRNAFIRRLAGKTAADDDERRVFSEELARLMKLRGHWFDKTLIRIYLKYLGLQSGRPAEPALPVPEAAPLRRPPAVSAVTAALWNLIGPSTHITFFILAALFFSPAVFFAFVIVAANLWMAGLFLVRAVIKPDETRV
jgi:phosphatidylglycerophosphate synthase